MRRHVVAEHSAEPLFHACRSRNDLAAKAFHHGGSLWVTGIDAGADTANPQQPVYKTFKLQLNCP
jgi:hypothetical protein